ncbi:MAG: NAD binding site:FAD dependent oxidoreductase [Rhodocyclaceae bacterium]|nr:MAG: NAD binding site:FAD dependent oxidoreductase [Rhodocyclaceae bacterium]TND05626.1 MAG: NAD binding site:FAD dependent oxidoreductase [Rhodocyclaceae bacterium]
MEKIDCAVIGAGVIGLAVARRLAAAGREVLILEAEGAFGTGISARNSEVIHAGVYYPAGSLKARLCVAGRSMLYAYCAERGIGHRRCGKLIVAAGEPEREQLGRIAAAAAANGVDDLQFLSRDAARALEPALECAAALLSPSTGIIDSHALMLSLLGDAERKGAVLALQSPVRGGEIVADGIVLDIGTDTEDAMQLHAATVVNCAGLGAQAFAQRLRGLPPAVVPPLSYAKGNYYALEGRAPFSRLIYPVPEAAGLGVHLTLDLGGQARFGPDVEWIDRIDYTVAPERADAFYAEVRRYWPQLPDGALLPAYAGIRPKPHAPGAAACDFLVSGPAEHGIGGLVCLYGIESPGLTACLALADHVADRLAC